MKLTRRFRKFAKFNQVRRKNRKFAINEKFRNVLRNLLNFAKSELNQGAGKLRIFSRMRAIRVIMRSLGEILLDY